MSKAILIMDMPESCHDCTMASPFVTDEGHKTWLCRGQFPFRDLSEVDAPKPDWCPLVPAIGYVQPVGNMVSWEEDGDVD